MGVDQKGKTRKPGGKSEEDKGGVKTSFSRDGLVRIRRTCHYSCIRRPNTGKGPAERSFDSSFIFFAFSTRFSSFPLMHKELQFQTFSGTSSQLSSQRLGCCLTFR